MPITTESEHEIEYLPGQRFRPYSDVPHAQYKPVSKVYSARVEQFSIGQPPHSVTQPLNIFLSFSPPQVPSFQELVALFNRLQKPEAVNISDWLRWTEHILSTPPAPRVFASHVMDTLTQEKFDELTLKWKLETTGLSSMSKILSNKNYHKILVHGWQAVPFILNDLKKEAAPWFSGLSLITNKEIGKEYRGRFRQIADAWIKWGTDEKLI